MCFSTAIIFLFHPDFYYHFSFRLSRRPEQWRSRQKSKINVYKEFLAEFVDEDIGLSEKKNPPANNSSTKAAVPEQTNTIKKMRQEIDSALASFTSPDPSKKHKKHKETRKGQADNNAEQKPASGKKKRKDHQEDDSSKTSMKKLKS